MDAIPPFERPSLSTKERCVRNSYLVRSLVNGHYYFRTKLGKEEYICATLTPFDVRGFKTYREAVNFSSYLENVKKSEICVGHPPFTRIEMKVEKIEVGIISDESSASSLM